MSRDILYKGSIAVIFTASLIVMYLFYLLMYPFEIIDIKKKPLKIENKTLKLGERLVIDIEYCKSKDYPAEVILHLVGDSITPLLGSPKRLPSGCFTGKRAYKAYVVLPLSTPEGKYTLWIIKKYKVNPLREITYYLETEEFTVIK